METAQSAGYPLQKINKYNLGAAKIDIPVHQRNTKKEWRNKIPIIGILKGPVIALPLRHC